MISPKRSSLTLHLPSLLRSPRAPFPNSLKPFGLGACNQRVVYLTDYAEKHGYHCENGYFLEDFALRGEEKDRKRKERSRGGKELGGLFLESSQRDTVYKGVINLDFMVILF